MPLPPPPPKTSPRAPARPPASNGSPASAPVKASAVRGGEARGQKVGIYGTGGIGKTELWSLASQVGLKVFGLDVDDGCMFLDVEHKVPSTWQEIRGVLQDKEFIRQFNLVAVDSLTRCQDYCMDWIIANVPHEKGPAFKVIHSIEDYGWNKGKGHLYETFLQLLGDLDAVARMGVNVVCVMHDCTSVVPFPSGEDFLRYEPRLYGGDKKGENSIRLRVKEWLDHLLFLGYDVHSEDGKAIGSGSRAIYPLELPTHMAKTRSLAESIVYHKGDATLWKQLFAKE